MFTTRHHKRTTYSVRDRWLYFTFQKKGVTNLHSQRQGLSLILKKKPGACKVEKLRSIPITEADLKFLNKLFIVVIMMDMEQKGK